MSQELLSGSRSSLSNVKSVMEFEGNWDPARGRL